MSVNEIESETSGSSPLDTLSYKAFVSDLAKKNSPLWTLDSLVSGNDFHLNVSTIISEFALLLTSLRVPGPSDFISNGNLLGVGAHFTVLEQDIIALANFQDQDSAFQNNYQTVAVKMPNFLLDSEQKLDLSDSKNSRQVRSMLLEITALCHPRLRMHPNLVNLLAWGTNTSDWHEVPFIALEIADTDLASLLRNRKDVSIIEKYCLTLDIACGLDAIHEVELVHGDLKPENVLIFCEPGHWVAKLADFGGAANIGKDGFWEGGGTVGWRAPEVRDLYESGKALDLSILNRVDSYSFGLLLWSVFLKERVRAPHDETNVDVEQIALADLYDNCKNMPTSLTITLRNSFSSLLKLDPRLRSNKTAPLLANDSQEYADKIGKLHIVQQNLNMSRKDHVKDGPPDLGVPEISHTIAVGLKTAFRRHEELSPTIMYALVVKLLSQGQDLDSNTSDRSLLLDLVYAAARQGHKPSQSIIFRIYEYFDLLPPLDILSANLSWVADSVSEGAFFLRAELQRMDANLYEESVAMFRKLGGYNLFYGSSITQYFSTDEYDGLELAATLNSHGDNALHIAATSDQPSTLSELLCLSSPQDINALNFRGETPLYRACMAGLTGNVLQLLSRSADASIRPSEESPGCLHWIFQFDASDINRIADELIGHGASINIHSKQKIALLHHPFSLPVGTALHWAVEMSVLEAATALLRNGANPCLRDGSDPYEYDDCVRGLDRILAPDNINFSVTERPTMGLNAFDLAVKNRDYNMLDILFSKESTNVADQIDEEGHSALHRLDAGHWLSTIHGTRVWKPCLEGSRLRQKEAVTRTVALLRQHGFQLDQLTKPQVPLPNGLEFDRMSPLMIAVARCRVDTTEALIEAGANVECANDRGRTALHAFGLEYRDFPSLQSAVITALLHSEPDVNVGDMDGDSPLANAARKELTQVGLALLERGADFCVRGSVPVDVGYGINVLATFCYCTIDEVCGRDEWMAMVLARFVLPGLREGNKRIKDEVITNAGLNGGNFLHFTAQCGLRRCCQLLLLEGVMDCNQLRRGRKISRRGDLRGIVTHYRTPLDEALEMIKPSNWRLKSSLLERDIARFLPVYEEIVEMLRAHGGVRGKTLKVETFDPSIPPGWDLRFPNNAI